MEEELKENNVEPVLDNNPKKRKTGLLIALLCAVLAIIVILLLFVLPGKKEEKDTITSKSETKSEYKMTGNSIEKFDLFFLKLENKEENKIYSPLSIKYALEMLSEGAQGETKAQLDAVIGDYKAKKYDNNNNMSFANAMFIRDTFADNVKDEFKNLLSEKYGAEIITDSFESTNTINNWISSKTFNLINDLVKDVNNKDFFIVNALGIDMKWNNLIHCATQQDQNVPCLVQTYEVLYSHEKLQGEENEFYRIEYPYAGEESFPSLKFNGKDNIKSARVLASFNRYDLVKTVGEEKVKEEVKKAYEAWLKTDEAKYFDVEDANKVAERFVKEINENYGKALSSTDFLIYVDDNVKAFAKDLQTSNGTTLQYVGIMPTKVTLKEYVEKVSVDDLNNVINNLKDMKIENFKDGYVTIIEGQIPMFKYEYELSLMEDLKKLGIVDVFDNTKADLSSMLKESEGIAIVEAKHKATIEFSNEGIKAAAATEEGGLGNAWGGFNYLFEVPTVMIDITFDNPYLYLIRDKNSGEIWFIGTVYEPITK